MRTRATFLAALLCGLALTACVTASPRSITVLAVDRNGTPQPYARVTASWDPPASSKQERVIILVNGTDEHGRFTIHDTELPESINVWSPDTHKSATIHRVKWGENVIVIR
jgi:phage terminase large subunit-like protein